MNEWVSRLAALLRELTGENLSINNAGPSREPDPTTAILWWKCSSGQPLSTVWIGMEASAAKVLVEAAKSVDQSGDLKADYNKLLQRLDAAGETVEAGPAGQTIDSFGIQWPGAEPLSLYVTIASADKWSNLEVLKDIELPVTLRFGTTRMTLQALTGLNAGSVIEFDGGLNDPVEVLVNGRVIARGEAVIVQDSYAVRISEIAGAADRIALQSEATGSVIS